MSVYTYIRGIYIIFEKKRKKKYLNSLIDNGLQIGKNVDIVADYFFDPSHCFLISIGDNCTIAPNVRLIAHDASIKKSLGYTKIGRIVIEENCFIGDSTIILPNVTIGKNTIVGAGSVITKDVPSNSVYAGNPAKLVSTVEAYIEKTKCISCDKKIYGEDYYIENLDNKKRQEIIQSVTNSMGFMV